MLFRNVQLPASVSGKLLLHSMPGRYEELTSVWKDVEANSVDTIVSLAEHDEIRMKSKSYAAAVESGEIPCERVSFPVCDFGIPSDADAYMKAAHDVAEGLKAGKTYLVHCAGGIGRTGTFVTAVLLRLGVQLPDALKIVEAAGSGPENEAQRKFLESLIPFTDG